MRSWSAIGTLLLAACGRGVWSQPGELADPDPGTSTKIEDAAPTVDLDPTTPIRDSATVVDESTGRESSEGLNVDGWAPIAEGGIVEAEPSMEAETGMPVDAGSVPDADRPEVIEERHANPTNEGALDVSDERALDRKDGAFDAASESAHAANDGGVADANADPASMLPPCSSGRVVIDEFPVPTPNAYVHGIVAGPDGAIWFTELDGNNIGRIDSAGRVIEFPVPDPLSGPGHIAPGPDGRLWFTELDTVKIAHADLDGTIVTMGAAYSRLYGIAVGPDRNVWFTAGSRIDRISEGAIIEFPISTADIGLGFIAPGPGGNLWFVESTTNKIGRIAIDGTHLAEFQLDAQTQPIGIVGAADGNLWFADYHGRIGRMSIDGRVTNFVVPIADTCPVGIAATQCDLWYTDNCANQIGRVTLDGTLTQLPIPTAASRPVFITAAPDGTIWFTENAGNQIGRIRFESTID